METWTNREDLEKFRKAGRIAARALERGLSLIRPGASLLEVCLAVEEEIRRLGGAPAFPAQISLNHVAAHYCAPPGDPTRFRVGDVAKLDVGAHVEGYVGDTAGTVNLGSHALLSEAAREARDRALEAVAPGVPIREVGRIVESVITAMGFRPVSNLTGHAVGVWRVHGSPQIPNVPERDHRRFEKGQILALEPFATTGRGLVTERGRAEVFSARRPRLKRRKGVDEAVLDAVEAYRGLPFARRNLAERFPLERVDAALALLTRKGDLHPYAPLAEGDGIYISQWEHTFYVGDRVEILTLPD